MVPTGILAEFRLKVYYRATSCRQMFICDRQSSRPLPLVHVGRDLAGHELAHRGAEEAQLVLYAGLGREGAVCHWPIVRPPAHPIRARGHGGRMRAS